MASSEAVRSSISCRTVQHQLSGSTVRSLKTAVRASRPCSSGRSRQVVLASAKDAGKVGLLAGAAQLVAPLAAQAVTTRDLAVELQGKIDSTSELSSQALKSAGATASAAKETATELYSAAKPVVEAAVPVVKKAAETVSGAATPVLKAGVDAAGKQLTSSGVDLSGVNAVSKAAGQVYDTTAPAVSSAAGVLSKVLGDADSTTISTALAAVGLGVLLWPVLGPTAAKQIRGYTSDISAASALDLISQGQAILIDIRDEDELINQGSPSLPRNASKALVEIPICTVDNKGLRKKMRNVDSLEAEATAVIITALKKVKKSTKIILMDRDGSRAKQVARSLSTLGRNSSVMEGGFSGRGGWVESSLGTIAGLSSKSFLGLR